jgi:hypothetical protein
MTNNCENVDESQMPSADDGEWLLSKTIQVTRGCHIEAERRLLGYAALVNHANIYYGCWSAILTILTLDQNYAHLALPAACFASSVALWAAYASAEKYELRAKGFFDSYRMLQTLWGDCEDAERLGRNDSTRKEKIKRYREEYYRIIGSTENHKQDDYVMYLYDQYRKDSERGVDASFSHYYWLKYVRYRVFYYTLRVLVYLIVPITLLASPKIIGLLIRIVP